MDDEESVESILARGGERASFGMQGWTYERELLTTVVDVLGQIHATLVQVNSENGRRPVVEPLKRPRTALDRVEAKRAVAEHEQRVRQWLGSESNRVVT